MRRVLALACHPSTPSGAVRRLDARVERAAAGTMTLVFVLEGELERLRIPPAEPARRGARLWEHTCFEAFVGAAGATAYHELNLAPSGAWAVHAFAAYRDGGPLDDAPSPRIAVRREAGRLGLEARLALDRLAPAYATAPLRVGLAAVVEASDGTRSYWALRHPAGRPDFHHDAGFALALAGRTP
jgi:hypothetical protein